METCSPVREPITHHGVLITESWATPDESPRTWDEAFEAASPVLASLLARVAAPEEGSEEGAA